MAGIHMQNRWIGAAVLLLLVGGTLRGEDNDVPENDRIDVLSFNIRYGHANDGDNSWPFRKEQVVDVIRRESPDFLGLQEAVVDPREGMNQVAYIAGHLPGYAWIGRSRDEDPGQGESTPIFYRKDRWRIDKDRQGTFWLSDTPEKVASKHWGNNIPRIATWAVFVEKSTGRKIAVVNTHFDHQSEPSRQRSAALVLRRLAEITDMGRIPSVVMGDFNCGEQSVGIQLLQGNVANIEEPLAAGPWPALPSNGFIGLRDTFRVIHPDAPNNEVGTFGAWVGKTDGAKIDYVFASPDLEVLDAKILHDNIDGRYPSDHYPVSAALRFPKQGSKPLAENMTLGQADPNDPTQPLAWRCSNETAGRWLPDEGVLELTGTGQGSVQWTNDTLAIEPGKLYRFSVRARRVSGSGGGCVPMGTSVHHRDYRVTDQWCEYTHVFVAPENAESAVLRLGLWETDGAVQFTDLRLMPVLPANLDTAICGLLGEGESVRDGVYRFNASFNGEGSNYHRPLVCANCGFNSNRWCFGSGSEVVYRMTAPVDRFLAARLEVNVNYHTQGTLVVEASRDGEAWTTVAQADAVAPIAADIPASLLPTDELFIRLRSEGPTTLQVDRFAFEGRFKTPGDRREANVREPTGKTLYAEVETFSDDVEVVSMYLTRTSGFYGNPHLQELLCVPMTGLGSGENFIVCGDGPFSPAFPRALTSEPGSEGRAACFIELTADAGQHDIRFLLRGEGASSNPPSESRLARISLRFSVPELYRQPVSKELLNTYNSGFSGRLLALDATQKVASELRVLPVREVGGSVGVGAPKLPLKMTAARNEFEAVQCVVQPLVGVKNLRATVTDLKGPDGAVIPADQIDILRVYYHWVENPTDKMGCVGWWPDALPPLDAEPVDVPANTNQPLWIRVHVPKDVADGQYEGTVTITADVDGDEPFKAEVPLLVNVWDFTLPDETTMETAFGLSYGNIDRYHRLKTEEDRRAVYEMYLQSFADHRISPYDWTPLDRLRVEFDPTSAPPSATLDTERYDREALRVKEKFGFNTFRLRVEGMGGGTFHDRYPPKIGEFTEDSPEYQAMFADYAEQLQEHLRAIGLLDEAFVYWFDEPDPKDYQFVADGFKRLERSAPDLRRMITEEPNDGFLSENPPINIWCPVSHNFDEASANARMNEGERFWWYVCCGPKTPYAGLFIDHPATELRVWAWQAWQRGIEGSLVWQTNYWTSSAAFPDSLQDPYEDPMGYVGGYSTPAGTKRFWGNGDGRFLYPPLSARDPNEHRNGPPIIEPPVSSIRWEMLREGIEDYEYLAMLRRLLDEKRETLSSDDVEYYEGLLNVPGDITSDMTTFTKTPGPIHERRSALAGAIERLIARP